MHSERTRPNFEAKDFVLDLNDIALFVHVVRSGSFAEAARRLGMPSNTIRRRVQGLEEQLGTRLLQRSTRKLTLTSAGEAFNARCADAVAELNFVHGFLRASSESVTPRSFSAAAKVCAAREQCVFTLPSEQPMTLAVSATSNSSQ